MGWLAGRHENGPATRAHSTRSAACEGSRRARLLRRTGEEGDVAPPKTRFLIGFARPRAMVSRRVARPEIENGLQTRIERAADVNTRSEGMLAEFEAPHRPS